MSNRNKVIVPKERPADGYTYVRAVGKVVCVRSVIIT